MRDLDRRYVRYSACAACVIVGALVAAVLTNRVGNTVATVLIGGGLLAIVVFLLRDMGLTETRARPRPPAEPPSNGGDPHHAESDEGTDEAADSGAGHGARRTASVRRPDRMRGQRRRLR